ncbi:MAG: anthranilate synthase component I [Treponema sp.]|nr:anthranilate synthase component I [Treponema sp.]MCL2251386.1 anthranilate synthase component I [Treponema sp.]
MLKPSLEEIKNIAASNQYKVIPLSTEIFSDMVTPISVLKKLMNVSKHCFILESAEDNKTWGRYTFLGFDPVMEITCINGIMTVNSSEKKIINTDNPNKQIQEILDQHKSIKFDYLPSFSGGLVGYFAYDYAKYCEPTLKLNAVDEENFNDVDLMLFDKVIAFDNFKQKIILIVNIKTKNFEDEYEKGKLELENLIKLINSGSYARETSLHDAQIPSADIKSDFKALFTKEEYCRMVTRAKDHIKEGDIFQVVLSNRYEADFEGSIFDTYRELRTINPSPYMFYFSGSNLEIAGASPETLVKLQDKKLFTYPLAGTRKRGETDEEDAFLEKDLLADEKELAEHNMLVDLGRNDLGKISKFGTVKVENYLSILKFSHVMHIGSTVSGEICDDKTGLDAINAVLPAGTLSGAPKIRAMQIINEQEKNKRGIYGGAIGYLDFTGNMDTCIAIRIVYKRNNKVFVRSGAGIVADSNPESEYQECVNKCAAVMKALKLSAEGIKQ